MPIPQCILHTVRNKKGQTFIHQEKRETEKKKRETEGDKEREKETERDKESEKATERNKKSEKER